MACLIQGFVTNGMAPIMAEQVHNKEKQPLWVKFSQLPATLIIGGILVGFLLCIALLSFVWTPYDPIAMNVRDRYLPIGSEGYLLGTDRFGRDVLTQIIMGARNSLFVSIISTLVSLMIGTLLGLYVAAAGGRIQNIISRTIDVGVAIPGILVAMVLATAIGPGNLAAITAIIIWFIEWPLVLLLARQFKFCRKIISRPLLVMAVRNGLCCSTMCCPIFLLPSSFRPLSCLPLLF